MSSLKNDEVKLKAVGLKNQGSSSQSIANILSIPVSTVKDFLNKITHKKWWESVSEEDIPNPKGLPLEGLPKILSFDIETAPILGNVWGLWQQNVGLNMILKDWYVLSWSAKWFHEDEVMYEDKRDSYDDECDLVILKGIHKLLDEADIVITQNGKKFDVKKLNARFLHHGMKPPSSYRHIDTLQIAKRHFGFTSNKLEYMTDKFCKTYKKLKHGKFPGFLLWSECLAGNMEAWSEMQEYNIYDVLSLEELYTILRPWMTNHPNLNVYGDHTTLHCSCGSEDLEHNGYHYTNLSKFDRFSCNECGAEVRGRVNLLSKAKRETLRMNVSC